MANLLWKYTWPWAVAATVLVAGFMYWLYWESSSIESGLAVADTAAGELPQIPDTAFVQDPSRFSRQRILLRPVHITDRLGRATLAADMPGLDDYPLILERSLIEEGVTVVGGDNLTVAGQVYALNDSILDVYAQRGLFDRENRERVSGHSTFFLVDSLDFIFPGEETGADTTGS
ncbi:MAG: hypothetical protein GWN99_01200 [Gemmatimonadetes bacterium]|uniref:Uncharacterized protein n=1 Tax=Candidatus Kutchimonas denitrificans TaxID=3056748 RepID=A0AAE5C9W2_9BACT|nr:hypothetical protein [Gemmatimonadota bacterium]NIR73877.1 hypothetical protein [Candidatus Kutchimonas denitrificans]NIR99683.1 hypothetical protein [Gemmatimonadota bacterium]NIT65268.1 hypothetical protein [Gemmatimonadota bacterium]NIW73717.1 hypothetical protein [Gemmatimonadota bacterium]